MENLNPEIAIFRDNMNRFHVIADRWNGQFSVFIIKDWRNDIIPI